MFSLSSQGMDLIHLLDTSVLVMGFVLLAQRRLSGLLTAYALQAFILALAAAWQAYVQDAPHLYVTAAIALVFKAIVIPVTLNHLIMRFKIRRTIEPVFGAGLTLMFSISLVALSILLVFPMAASAGTLTKESLAIALSVVLFGFLMMITRHNAISMVVGFMSLENGLVLAAVSVRGMPLVVEISISFSVLVAFIIFGVFFFHIRERFETFDIHQIEKFRGEQSE